MMVPVGRAQSGSGVFMIGVALLILAQGQQASLPAHPEELEYEPLVFTPPVALDYRHELPNGVAVYVVEDHDLPLFTVQLLVRTGSYQDPPDKRGLASFTGSQIREGGTSQVVPARFDEEADYLAAALGSSVGITSGGAQVNCLSKDLERCLEIFFDMLRHPGFDAERIDLAKSQRLQEMGRRNDDTSSIERREWSRLLYGPDHFTTLPTTQNSLDATSREDLASFHRANFPPGAFMFAVSGDIDTNNILAILAQHLEGWRVPEGWSASKIPAPAHAVEPGLYLVHKEDVNQGRVSIGHLGSTRNDPDRYALQVMNNILGGGGFTARILSRVRSDEGLAYSAGSSFALGTYWPGTFRASFQSRSEATARATAIVLEEIRRIRDEPVSAQELADAKISFIEPFTQRFANPAAVAGLFARDEFTGRENGYWQSYREHIAAVTVEDVQRVARKHLRTDALVILVVGNIDDILADNPDNLDYSLKALAPGGVVKRIPLPDALTMEYLEEEPSRP